MPFVLISEKYVGRREREGDRRMRKERQKKENQPVFCTYREDPEPDKVAGHLYKDKSQPD